MVNSGDRVWRVEVTRARARAEFTEWSWLLAEYRAGVDAIDETPGSWHWRAEENGVVLDLALACGFSEHETRTRITAMSTLQDRLPSAWLSFRAGGIDSRRVLQLVHAAGHLQREESVAALDQNAVGYAESHTAAELKRWLTKFLARIEPATANENAEKAKALRHVQVRQVGDGMAWVSALLPAPAAVAIDGRLSRVARRLVDDEDAHRTLAQRRADLFAAWLTSCDEGVTTTRVAMDIAVVVPVEALAGRTDLPAAASDWSWTVPADWLLELAGTGNSLWHRIVTDPAGHVLDHTYLGRFAPDTLAAAIAFRDEVCTTPGCTRPATACEADHVVPHPRGPTAGFNLEARCRRHHTMKGTGVLDSTGLTRPRHSRPREHDPTFDYSIEGYLMFQAAVRVA